jgi:hypothetical protein
MDSPRCRAALAGFLLALGACHGPTRLGTGGGSKPPGSKPLATEDGTDAAAAGGGAEETRKDSTERPSDQGEGVPGFFMTSAWLEAAAKGDALVVSGPRAAVTREGPARLCLAVVATDGLRSALAGAGASVAADVVATESVGDGPVHITMPRARAVPGKTLAAAAATACGDGALTVDPRRRDIVAITIPAAGAPDGRLLPSAAAMPAAWFRPLYLFFNGDEAKPDHLLAADRPPEGWRNLGVVACAVTEAGAERLAARPLRRYFQAPTDEHTVALGEWPSTAALEFEEEPGDGSMAWSQPPAAFDPGYVELRNLLRRRDPEYDWTPLVVGSDLYREFTGPRGYVDRPDAQEVWGESFWAGATRLCAP